MYLDKFQDLMAENMKEEDDGIARTYLQAFLNYINADNFHEVLELLEQHYSRLAHAKVCCLFHRSRDIRSPILCPIHFNRRERRQFWRSSS